MKRSVTDALRFGNYDALFVDLTKHSGQISFDPGDRKLIWDEATMRLCFILMRLKHSFIKQSIEVKF